MRDEYTPEILARFWSYVDRDTSPHGCWLWLPTADRRLHGSFSFHRKTVGAHRFAWMVLRGPIPAGAQVLHNCPDGDNPACVNPAHLFLGTQRDNIRDMIEKGRKAMGNTVPHEKRVRGENINTARLAPSQIPAVRAMLADGVTVSAVARHFGMSRGAIRKVRDGRSWTHIAQP